MRNIDFSKKIIKDFNIEVKEINEDKRTLMVCISTPNTDRYGDEVMPLGMKYDNYLGKNPVVLFAHNYEELPIGRCVELSVSDNGVMATVEFVPEGVYDKADTVYQMAKLGFLNAWSIGCMVLDYEPIENTDGYRFLSWELLEFSAVTVPANAEALTLMRSKGLDVDPIIEQPAEVKPEEPMQEEPSGEAKEDEPVVETTQPIVEEPVEIIEEPKQEEPIIVNVDGEETPVKSILEAVEIIKTLQKSGRTISSKHEKMLTEACDHMNNAMESVKGVLSSIQEDPEDNKPNDAEDNNDGDKSIKTFSDPQYLKRLVQTLKNTDKSVGLTLRLIKSYRK